MTESEDLIYPCRLYLISPPTIELGAFAKTFESALNAGDVGAFQLRLKGASDKEIREAVRVLMPLCRAKGTAFILNDRVDLALELEVDGVHLGQEDMMAEEARRILGKERVIGVSCHDSSHLAMEAGDHGADYVAFGAFYPTTSKTPDKLAKYGTPKPDIIEWWSTYTLIPCVAIGGIQPQNCGPLVEAGADFVAAINAVWSHPKGAAEAVKEFNQAIKKALKRQAA
ncbi:MAG: thiamine phosphate synthase [Alphaproteobacteria bacterium]|nr:thiamine phosphate synthase [Alphaproteobacteria bacterium]